MKPPIPLHAAERKATSVHPLGMSAKAFLRDFWQKRPLLIRAASADFENPIEPDDLAGLACEELALARIAIHEPKRDRWTLRNGPFAETDFASLPPSHWTLLVQDVDKWDADAAALLAPFNFLPDWRIDDVMVSYAEDGGSVGAHVDQYDVFLLQGLGHRRWQISTDPDAPTSFRDDAELKLLREFTPTHEWILEPGDMLYLPPGVPHHGVAIGACMTYSIGMRAPSNAELAGDFVDQLLDAMPDESRYTDTDLLPSRGDGEIDEATFARVRRTMPWIRFDDDAPLRNKRNAGESAGGLDPSLLRGWFGRFITRYRSAHAVAPNPRPLTDAAFARARGAGARVHRYPWSRAAWMRNGKLATLFVAGEGHHCSIEFARVFCTQREFSLNDVANDKDRRIVRALIDGGHLAIAAMGRKRKSP